MTITKLNTTTGPMRRFIPDDHIHMESCFICEAKARLRRLWEENRRIEAMYG